VYVDVYREIKKKSKIYEEGFQGKGAKEREKGRKGKVTARDRE
jgi:hypothetical protein